MAIETPIPASVRRLSLDDVLEMVDAGIIDPNERVELVDGVLIQMSPEGSPHGGFVARLNRVMHNVYSEPVEVRVNTTLPLSGPHHYRLPDLLITEPIGMARWAEAHEAILAVEVAQTSLATDLGPKALEYASWGAATYWVIDLNAQIVIVHTDPVDGRYSKVIRRSGDDLVTFPGVDRTMSAAELLRFPS